MLSVREPGACTLLFWKLPLHSGLEEFLFDAITGFTGIWGVSLDCALEGEGGTWVITSGEFRLPRRKLSGPHYAPIEACRDAALARFAISSVIDP